VHATSLIVSITAGFALSACAAAPPKASEVTRHPTVVGDAAFTERVGAALALLASRAPEAHELVVTYVGRVGQSARSGMNVHADPPTLELADVTVFYSVTWCAASIVHDAQHAKLYTDYARDHDGPVPAEIWTGQAAEQACMRAQHAALLDIGAPERESTYLAGLDGTHHDVDGDVEYTWADYWLRNW